MSVDTDLVYGRRGGNWAPTGAQVFDMARYRVCDGCGGAMVARSAGRTRHFVCDPEAVIGRQCTCPPGCTDLTVGDGHTCAGDCQPCQLRQGLPYDQFNEWGKRKK